MLNPDPLIKSSIAFYVLKYSYIFFILTLGVSVLKPGKKYLVYELSLFCIACLLLLPVNASYQYVVLIPSAVILFKYYSDQKRFFPAAAIVLLMFVMNSHMQIMVTDYFRNTPLYIFSYVKLIGLLIFFAVNIQILLKLNSSKLFNKRTAHFAAFCWRHSRNPFNSFILQP